MSAHVWIGTSGWSYPHWGKGVFYPKSVPTQDWLTYYSGVFTTVEVNSTFYRLPNPVLLERWVNVTPDTFRFSVKVWRRITHDLRLQDVEDELLEFRNSLQPLQEKVAVFLIQTPPSYIPEIESLEKFIRLWKKIFPLTRVALELRNKKAFTEEVFQLLSRHRIAVVIEDYRGSELEDRITADWVYIRRHGPSGRYRGEYDLDYLRQEARRIRSWQKKGYDVYVYFNNDFGGYAPKNALQLMELIKKGTSD